MAITSSHTPHTKKIQALTQDIEKGPTPPPLPLILPAMAADHRQGAHGPA